MRSILFCVFLGFRTHNFVAIAPDVPSINNGGNHHHPQHITSHCELSADENRTIGYFRQIVCNYNIIVSFRKPRGKRSIRRSWIPGQCRHNLTWRPYTRMNIMMEHIINSNHWSIGPSPSTIETIHFIIEALFTGDFWELLPTRNGRWFPQWRGTSFPRSAAKARGTKTWLWQGYRGDDPDRSMITSTNGTEILTMTTVRL